MARSVHLSPPIIHFSQYKNAQQKTRPPFWRRAQLAVSHFST